MHVINYKVSTLPMLDKYPVQFGLWMLILLTPASVISFPSETDHKTSVLSSSRVCWSWLQPFEVMSVIPPVSEVALHSAPWKNGRNSQHSASKKWNACLEQLWFRLWFSEGEFAIQMFDGMFHAIFLWMSLLCWCAGVQTAGAACSWRWCRKTNVSIHPLVILLPHNKSADSYRESVLKSAYISAPYNAVALAD